MKKKAFTLAEVLITLSIIGVVAALTLPNLIAKHQKNVVVTRMQKFYTTINQAIIASEIDNGDTSEWATGSTLDYASNLEFYNKYLKKYLNVVKHENDHYERLPIWGVKFYLADGSAFTYAGSHIVFYPVANRNTTEGKDTFIFVFSKIFNDSKNTKRILPYGLHQTTDRNRLINDVAFGCARTDNVARRYCAALIMMDGWKISDDYPVKF